MQQQAAPMIAGLRNALRGTRVERYARNLKRAVRYYRLPRIERKNWRYDQQTLEVMQRVRGNQIDIGCANGVMLKNMIECSPEGHHVAFEPLPHLADKLRTEFPDIEIHEVALCEYKGTAVFHYAKNYPGRSGLRQHEYPGEPDLVPIEVETELLDSVVHHVVDLIKIDVEGAEFAVLSGGAETLRRNRPVVVFEHGAAARYYGTDSAELFDFLSEAGLNVYLMHRWLQGRQPLSKNQFVKHVLKGSHWYFVAAPRLGV